MSAHDLAGALLGALDDAALAALAQRLRPFLDRADEPPADRWLTTTQAAAYLGCHRDTLRKLAAQRAIPCEQDAPGCKLYFRLADLDRWRAAGGKPAHRARAA